MCLEQQIKLEWFLKDQVTLKKFSFAITETNYIIKYIIIKQLF